MSRSRAARAAATAGVAVATVALLFTPVAAAQTACEDLLVTHRPDGSSGDTAAITVTSQALERDAAGWSSVGWEVASSVEVRTVLIDSPGGQRELRATERYAEGSIEALHVCGTHDATTAADGPNGEASPLLVRASADGAGGVGGGVTGPALLGAAVGATLGGVVLLLSRGARRAEVAG